MKRAILAKGALALTLMLAACGGAPSATNTDATAVGSEGSTGMTGTSPAGTTGEGSTGMTGTSTTGQGTTGTSTAGQGTTGTSTAGQGTTGTSTAGQGTTGTSTAGQGTTGTSTTGQGTTGTSTAGQGTTGTSTTGQGTTGTSTTGQGTTGTSTAGQGTTGTSTTGQGTTGTSTTGTTSEGAIGAIATDPQFSTLSTLLTNTGLAAQLEAAGPVTIFAPTDEAFAALPQGTLAALSQDPTTLMQILRYHVAEGAVRSTDITAESSVPTLAGEDVTLDISGDTIRVNDVAEVVQTDIRAGSSIIHAIDQVLLPSTVNVPPTGSGN